MLFYIRNWHLSIFLFFYFKSSKPIMEKRRRARINESLGQLKTLIMDALKKDVRSSTLHFKSDDLETK